MHSRGWHKLCIRLTPPTVTCRTIAASALAFANSVDVVLRQFVAAANSRRVSSVVQAAKIACVAAVHFLTLRAFVYFHVGMAARFDVKTIASPPRSQERGLLGAMGFAWSVKVTEGNGVRITRMCNRFTVWISISD